MTESARAQLSGKKRALLELMLQRRQAAATGLADEIRPRVISMHPPLTAAQRRFLFQATLQPESTSDVIRRVLRVQGPLDLGALRRALGTIVARHEVLRSRVEGDPPNVRMHVDRPGHDPLQHVDLSGTVSGVDDPRVTERIARDLLQPFELHRDHPLRMFAYTIGPDEHLLLLAIHHMVADGSSLELLYAELGELYAAFVEHRTPVLPALPVQYGDYAIWADAPWSRARVADQRTWWIEHLRGIEPLEFPLDRPRPPVRGWRGARFPFAFDEQASAAVRNLAKHERTTVFITLLSGFCVLLSRYSGQTDVVLGTVVTNRWRPELQSVIGCFINTVVLRTDLSGEPTFRDVLQRARTTAVGAYDHQDVPFDELVTAVAPRRDPSRAPLYSVLFAHQDGPFGTTPKLRDLRVEFRDVDPGTAQLDLSLYTWFEGDRLMGHVEYDVAVLDAEKIAGVVRHLRTLLVAAERDPQMPIARLPLLDDAERMRALPVPEAVPPRDDLVRAFEAQVRARPTAPAVTFAGVTLDYATLGQRAATLAGRLRAAGVTEGDRVAVCMNRSEHLVVALLAIAWIGACYVPVDPNYPEHRIAQMFETCAPSLTLTTGTTRLPALPTATLEVEAIDPDARPVDAVPPDPERLAYIIFTSGSTGRPKGVEISTGALANLLHAMAERVGFGADDRWLAITTISFDIAGLELLGPLYTGGQVVVASEATARDPLALVDTLERAAITVLQATPATWALMIGAGWSGRPSLTMLSGGEALSSPMARDLVGRGRALWNLYGPTEATIWASAHRVRPGEATFGSGVEPLGEPLEGLRLAILDPQREPTPPGVPGELYIGGAGLSRGYVGAPELTAERFVADPVHRGDILYRTGDLVRRRFDGTLEFLGRIDHQVKLRGHRIELGEIETALVDHPEVGRAIVLLRDDGPTGPALVAYIETPRPDDLGLRERVREHLRQRLPEVMIPTAIVALARLPSTPAGKIDRAALPSPAQTSTPSRAAGAGRSEADPLLLQVVAVFEDVLGRAGIDPDDDFFSLGGHSLLAMRLVHRIRGTLGRTLPLVAVFNAPTPAQLTALLRAEGATVPWSALEPIAVRGTGSPLFFIGFTSMARRLARSLPPERSVWGLNPLGLWQGKEHPAVDARSVATALVREIKLVRPRGPYNLMGYCNDAKIAFEVARQLIDAGDEVPFLGFVDLLGEVTEVRGVRRHLRNVLVFGPDYVTHHARSRLRRIAGSWRRRALGVYEKLAEDLGLAIPERWRDELTVTRYYAGLQNHRVQPHRGRVYLFLSKEWAPMYGTRTAPPVEGDLVARVVSGYHDTIFLEPHASMLAAAVEVALREADGAAPGARLRRPALAR